MTGSFIYSGMPIRIVFGQGCMATLRDEAARLGLKRVLILSTAHQRELAGHAKSLLGELAVGIFAGARRHTPVSVTAQAQDVARDLKIDGIVSVGGGSTIGLGKALVARMDINHIAVPTTYAGSEMTPILGETHKQGKVTFRDERLRPQTVIYDVDLTYGLPVRVSVTSGINAAAHAVEALYAKDRNPLTSLIAAQSLRAIASALPVIRRDAADPKARSDALYGAWLAGICLGSVSMSLHHKLCHTLGGSFDLPHAETHTVILPHVVKFVAAAEPAAMQQITDAIGATDAAQGLFELIGSLDGPRSLRELGMTEDQLELATARALEKPYWSPVLLQSDGIRFLLDQAFRGDPPA